MQKLFLKDQNSKSTVLVLGSRDTEFRQHSSKSHQARNGSFLLLTSYEGGSGDPWKSTRGFSSLASLSRRGFGAEAFREFRLPDSWVCLLPGRAKNEPLLACGEIFTLCKWNLWTCQQNQYGSEPKPSGVFFQLGQKKKKKKKKNLKKKKRFGGGAHPFENFDHPPRSQQCS